MITNTCSMRARRLVAALAFGVLAASAVRAAPSAPAPIDPHWRLVGPFRGGWGEMVVGIPDRPDSFLFGAAGGGVWRSDNAGRTWTSLFDHGPTAPIGALAVAPSNPDVIYLGSGQPEPRYDMQSGAGVFASRDGGKSWASLGLEKTLYIGRVWVDPRNADTVLVAAVGDFFAPGGRARDLPQHRRRQDLDPCAGRGAGDRRGRHRRRPVQPQHPVRRDLAGAPVSLAELLHRGRRSRQRRLALGRRRGELAQARRRGLAGGLARTDQPGVGAHRHGAARLCGGVEQGGRRALSLGRRRRLVGPGQRRAGFHQLLRQPGDGRSGRPGRGLAGGPVGAPLRSGRRPLHHLQGRAGRGRLPLRLDQPEASRPHRHRQRPGGGGQRRRRQELVVVVQPAHRPVLSPGHGRSLPLPDLLRPAG